VADVRPDGGQIQAQELSAFKRLLGHARITERGLLPDRLRMLFGMTSDLGESAGRETVVQFLERTTLFGGLGRRDLGWLARCVHVRHFHDGESIYEEGRPGAALFLLRQGKVEITKRMPDGTALSIATLGPPASFEELAAIGPDIARWTSARAKGAVELLALGRSDLESLARQSPSSANEVIVRLAEVTARRLRTLLESQGLLPDVGAG
jgi:hypothetical protein